MEKEINNLKKLDDLQKQNEELQNEVNDLQRENDELENEVNDLQRQNEELQNEVDDLQSQNEKLQKENNNLQNQNNRIKKQNKELENKNAELQNRVESVPENPTEEPEQETGPELEREPEQETEPERETESEEDPLDRPEEMRVDNYLDNLYYSIEKLFNLTPDDRENENKIHELENSVMKIRTDIDNAFHNMDLSASQEMRLEDLHDRLNTLSREIERHKKTTKKNK
ncbi:hypothetical protein J5751_03625 [bacterium]|nr:hypothetical protein [bacterium]